MLLGVLRSRRLPGGVTVQLVGGDFAIDDAAWFEKDRILQIAGADCITSPGRQLVRSRAALRRFGVLSLGQRS